MKNATDKISDFLTKWWRPIGFLFIACYTAFTMYNAIIDNSSTNDSQEIEIKDTKELFEVAIKDTKELFNAGLQTLDGRGEKRHKRLLDKIKEIESILRIKDRQIEQLQKDVAFMQGQAN